MKKTTKYILIIVVIVLIILGYHTWKYYQCLQQEGTDCDMSLAAQKNIASETPVLPIVPKGKVKCSFWSGKTCI